MIRKIAGLWRWMKVHVSVGDCPSFCGDHRCVKLRAFNRLIVIPIGYKEHTT